MLVIGQSQGAGAAIATAAYAPGYAPEIELLGVVATGVPFFSPETLIAVQKARPKNKVDSMLGYNFLALTLVEQLLPEFQLGDYVFEPVRLTATRRLVCRHLLQKESVLLALLCRFICIRDWIIWRYLILLQLIQFRS